MLCLSNLQALRFEIRIEEKQKTYVKKQNEVMNEVKQEMKLKQLKISIIQNKVNSMQKYKQKKRKISAMKLWPWEQTFQQGTFDVGEEVLDPGERL